MCPKGIVCNDNITLSNFPEWCTIYFKVGAILISDSPKINSI